ncbi:MAG: alpha-glucan family phosphorylase [Deltaproteobacteria bacterium]|nr:alpha-glucan family phosphorylase [Deltaproteobacteria bacterium]
MSHLQIFQVIPYLPDPISFLGALARNYWWCWQRDAFELFRRIDPKLWKDSRHNPILFLTRVPQARFEELARDNSFLAQLEQVQQQFEQDLNPETTNHRSRLGDNGTIAYFSMEFGIHESLPLFAGGLGVLAGDHLKAASDIKLPLMGIGLLYREGYFKQFLNQDGWQQESYPETELFHLPVRRAKDVNGEELKVSVEGPDGPIHATVWELRVGRIPLFLLDTNVKENDESTRNITARLYEGDQKIRLAQEMILGIGGIRALTAMGIHPTVCHMNEGHSAFSSLERLAQIMRHQKLDLKTALQIIPRTTVFTTHTPVSAGHDEFPAALVKPYIQPLEEKLNTTADHILSWGQTRGSASDAPVSMFVLGLRMAQYCNGVSRLHGQVARKMWSPVWPNFPVDEVPISHVTNGIHPPTWISHEICVLFERHLTPDWHFRTQQPEIVDRIDDIYEDELWRAHETSRFRLIRKCRELMVRQHGQRNAPKTMMESAGSVLDQGVLTIVFARRFAAYKRAHLLLQDPERLKALLRSETRPVQIIFAGKAHPKDHDGKLLIQQLYQFVQLEGLGHRIIFLEDYDMHLARYLIQGADVWLNTPRRPLEACGTSGMKAALNGSLNVSILDGWWCEGYSESLGWRIGDMEEYQDHTYQDSVEGQALYNVLENEVIPLFYERKGGDTPERWLQMMKASMKMALAGFSGHRMIAEYENRFYLPAAAQMQELSRDGAGQARALSFQTDRLHALWRDIRIDRPNQTAEGPFQVGEQLTIDVTVHLGEILPEEVNVELYYGRLKSIDQLVDGQVVIMSVAEDSGNGAHRYACTIDCENSGRFGFMARVRPRADKWIQSEPAFITWADS